MTPFAPVTDKGMFDYATGKWAPAKFKNYVTGEIDHHRSIDRRHASRRHSRSHSRPQLRADRARRLGRTEVAERRRQPLPQRPRHRQLSPLGRRARRRAASISQTHSDDDASFTTTRQYRHQHLRPRPSGEGACARMACHGPASRSTTRLSQLESKCPCNSGLPVAQHSRPSIARHSHLREKVAASNLDAASQSRPPSSNSTPRSTSSNPPWPDALGLDLIAFRTNEAHAQTARLPRRRSR